MFLNVNKNEDFELFDKCVKELEKYYISKYGNKVHAVYGMSMGGVFASILWQNQNIIIDKLIMESSPLLGFGSMMRKMLTRPRVNMDSIYSLIDDIECITENHKSFLKLIINERYKALFFYDY